MPGFNPKIPNKSNWGQYRVMNMKPEESNQKIIEDILNIPSESQTLEFKRLAEEKVVK